MSLQEKYRPRLLADISGQENVKKGIRRFVLSPGFQVLFFLGPTGVGKTSLANIIAKLCMCENFSDKTPDACGICESCVDVEKYEQYYLIKHYCNGRTMEELESDIDHWRYGMGYPVSVLFIDEVGYLGSKGLAILQKAVDEIREEGTIPGRRLVLILATTPNFYRKIDSAFKGRSRLVRFGKLTSQDITRRLQFIANTEGLTYEPEAIDALSADVELGMRHAIGLLDQVAETGKKIDNKLIYRVLRLPPEELFLSILGRLNSNPKSMFLRANKWIDFVGLEAFRQNLYRSYYTLRLMHAKLPIRRIMSLKLSNRYEDVVQSFHAEELRIISDVFNSRRFLESDNSDRVLEMLLNLSYRLVKLEFELESVEDLRDKIERRIREGRRRSKHK